MENQLPQLSDTKTYPKVSNPSKKYSQIFPGVAMAVALATVATVLGKLAPIVGAPVFAIVIGIVLSTLRKPKINAEAGLKFSAKTVLQASIVILGTGLSFTQVVTTGTSSMPVLIGTLLVALVGAWFFGRLLGITKDLRSLIGVGTAICGASAVAATDAVISASLIMGNSEAVLEIVRTDRADIGFVEGWAVPSQFEQSLVCSDDLVVVVSPSHHWANRKKVVTSRELAKTSLIMREPGSGTREVLHRALGAQGLAPVSRVELASNTALKSMVISGAGPGVLSRLATKAEVESGQLVIVRTRGLSLERSIKAVWPQGRKLSQAARRLLEVAVGTV